MLKVVKFLEVMWLLIAICCIVIGTYKLITNPDFMDAMFFYTFCLLAMILYFLRRRQRKNLENTSQQ